MTKYLFTLIILSVSMAISAKEYHVSKEGNDNNNGTFEFPFLTIQAAADIAQSGDVITVHEGIYREQITPLEGGSSDKERIVYQAAEGEHVVIKGSEVIKNWENFKGTVWKVTIPNTFFGDYNPYKDVIDGDWYNDNGRDHHTGEVYMNEKSFWEMDILEKVLHPKQLKDKYDSKGSIYTWYCESDDEKTYIYANFHGADPNKELVEINVRRSCFYPDTTGINYITVRGFKMTQAATQWAPPTAEQIGLIGTHWSKGWIIENNVISNSRCAGITLGKYGDEYDNTSANSAEGYIETVKRALNRGWNKENIGSHIVRNNTIFDCEQVAICGSLGGIFSVIEGNDIYNIYTKRLFKGPETAGIKIHASIDMLIKGNRVVNTGRGIWVDWMAQGARISGNLCYHNDLQDFYAEVNHGPYLVDNNIFLSICSIWDMSQGGAYAHNLLAGRVNLSPHSRVTPYHYEHSTEIAGYHELVGGDNRFYNNIFLRDCKLNIDMENPELDVRLYYGKEDFGLSAYNEAAMTVFADGNAYLNGASVFENGTNYLMLPKSLNLSMNEDEEGVYLEFEFDKALIKMKNNLVTTDLLGKTKISKLPFVQPDSSLLAVDTDFFGNQRHKRNPMVGPFEIKESGIQKIAVWEF